MDIIYSEIYIQFVFAVKGKQSLILPSWEEELYKYITGLVENKNHKMIAINSVPDHLHFFVDFDPNSSLDDLVEEVKKSTITFVNSNFVANSDFNWQEGYGGFSYSKSAVDEVVKHIMNQKNFHREISFKDEYISLLNEYKIDFEEKYLFDWII